MMLHEEAWDYNLLRKVLNNIYAKWAWNSSINMSIWAIEARDLICKEQDKLYQSITLVHMAYVDLDRKNNTAQGDHFRVQTSFVEGLLLKRAEGSVGLIYKIQNGWVIK
jgi:hypothetical protein